MYNVIDAPGFFGQNKARVYSRHSTIRAARAAARTHEYLDERGQRRCPVAVVVGDKQRGDHYWGDMYPEFA